MNSTKPREILRIVDAGTADNGRHLRFTIEFRDGSFESFELAHERVGEFIGKLVFGADAANHARLEAAGHRQKLEPTGVLDILAFQAQASQLEPIVLLRMTIARAVHLGFRIPIDRVQELASALLATIHPSDRNKH